MNSKLKFCALLSAFALTAGLCGCADNGTGNNGGTSNGGGNNNSGNGGNNSNVTAPVEIQSELAEKAEEIISSPQGASKIPNGSTKITGKITIDKAGSYYVNSEISGKKITVDCAGVTLYLSGAKLSNEKKVIESNYPLTLTLLGENTVSNSNAEGSNAIDCAGDLVINGSGSLKINSTKNGIKANSVSVIDSKLEITSENDGLHAEVDSYDDATSVPSPSYGDGGYVYLNGASVTVNSGADGIQADTFVYISESTVDLTAGGGAPKTVNASSSNNASGKGIKAGAIDWGANKTDLDWDEGLIHIKSGNISINSDDDAINSKGEANIADGDITIQTGDDAIHADKTLNIGSGKVNVTKSSEGLEATYVNILGGEISLIAADDGINAGGGADSSGFGGNDGPWGWGGNRPRAASGAAADRAGDNPASSINVSGGKVYIDSTGDGLDSNGDIIISGGEVYVNGPTSSMDAPIDYDGNASITGGVVVAVGSGGMAQNFGSASTQGSILYTLPTSGSGAVALKQGGNELISFTPAKNYNSVVVSCPEIVKGGTYTLTAGGKDVTITMTDLIYGKGFSMGGR